MSGSRKLRLFEGFGVELEYMLVDSGTLDVRPVCDELFRSVTGDVTADIEFGDIAWSNELALHVVELKTNGPAASLAGLAARFQEHVCRINRDLRLRGWQLMPGAMHPWMNPDREMKLWPHEYNAVYEAYHRIFDCRGHGWSNLQSTHLNLPFSDDPEFGRLHAAVRLVLPLLPAIAASSPVHGGTVSGFADSRLEFYRTNSARIPSLTAGIVPEAVFSRAEYERQIFDRIYADIAPHDPQGVLRDEFLNSRGAIARFGRGSIEIRILDIQECVPADLAVCELVVALLQSLCAEKWGDSVAQRAVSTGFLRDTMRESIRLAEQTTVSNREWLGHFGWTDGPCSLQQLWKSIAGSLAADHPRIGQLMAGDQPLQVLIDEGNLSRRLLVRLGGNPSRTSLEAVWQELCSCLEEGRMFRN